MYYSPHKLYVRHPLEIERDADGFPTGSSGEEWKELGGCRADNDGNTEVADERGNVIRAAYHIVADKCSVQLGDYVRVPGKDGCEGRVIRLKNTNYFNYTELWI